MVLLNSNFSIILAAVEEGRGIFDNLKKVLLYLLADAFAEIILVVSSIVLGWPLPLLAVQILWINLVSDGFPYLALTMEPKNKGLLKRKPIARDKKILDQEIGLLVGLISVTAGLMSLGIFGWYYFVLEEGVVAARNITFAMLAVNSLVYVFSSRSLSKPVWRDNYFKNWWLIFGVLAGFVMQLSVMYLPRLQAIFKTQGLSLFEWGVVFGSAGVLIVVIEGVKWGYLKRGEGGFVIKLRHDV